jgi:hypothetical protein
VSSLSEQCALLQQVLDATRRERDKAELERDAARAIARALAHSYVHDSRPPQAMVDVAMGYPADLAPRGRREE